MKPHLPWRLQAPRGFTLLEVCIAMGVGALLIGIATLSISGISDQNKLQRQASAIELTARESLLSAVMKQHPVRIDLEGGFGGGGEVLVKRYGERQFRKPQRGEYWEFSPTGVCEPLEVRVVTDTGTVEMGFDPLTACARRRSLIVKG